MAGRGGLLRDKPKECSLGLGAGVSGCERHWQAQPVAGSVLNRTWQSDWKPAQCSSKITKSLTGSITRIRTALLAAWQALYWLIRGLTDSLVLHLVTDWLSD
jgi:hypothetical protein